MDNNNAIGFDDIDVESMNIDGLEVVSLKDALALPETGASSGISSCNSCSTCGSTSTCGSCNGGDGGSGGNGGNGGSPPVTIQP
ncbi:thiazolylpeptide-type bacteriocin [Aquimonas voraii]|uniref:Thiazolylpeptide-type bacteriocin n=1 Tax=Aquimonas voraii TaxID=265719 RepID=A0A1G6Y1L1_9GAMM|nr:thiazolylpeptide-type bacteriocin [Aquimonas voraii]SDD84384.1 thiazolylpeptide-type bacteriocin precursor [Aquimonas voraii]